MLTVFLGKLTVHDPLHVDRKQSVSHHSNREFDNSMEREKLRLFYNEFGHFRCRVLHVARGACFANHIACFYIDKYAYIGHLIWKNVMQSFSKTFSIGKLKKSDSGQNSVRIPHVSARVAQSLDPCTGRTTINQQQKNIKNIDQSNEHISDSKQANYNPVAKRWGRKYVSKITEKMSLPKQYIKICNSYKV